MIDTTDTTVDSWKEDRLVDTEASLTEIITNSPHRNHHALANRALVRRRLRDWHHHLAIDDARNVGLRSPSRTLVFTLNYHKSIEICPSVIGYIAKSVALIGGGKKVEGCQAFDLAFRHCRPNEVDFLLLIKVCVFSALKLGCTPAACFIYLFRLSSCSWLENMSMPYRA